MHAAPGEGQISDLFYYARTILSCVILSPIYTAVLIVVAISDRIRLFMAVVAFEREVQQLVLIELLHRKK